MDKAINNKLDEQRVSFELAKLLKEKGFQVPTKGCYTKYLKTHKSDNPSFAMTKGELEVDSEFIINKSAGDLSNENYYQCARPTHQLVIEWLYINYGLYVWVQPHNIDGGFISLVQSTKKPAENTTQAVYSKKADTPKEALEKMLTFTLTKLI
jgi:hypothetical protein